MHDGFPGTGSPPPRTASPLRHFFTRLPIPSFSGPVLGLAGILLFFALLFHGKGQLGTFLSLRNLQVLLHSCSVTGVIALGMLVIIVIGGIDLSVGSVVALVTVVTMQVYRPLEPRHGMAAASLAAVAAGVGVGGLAGLVNGLAITRLRVTPFVATLGMLSIARGLAVWLAGRKTISFPGARPGWVDALSRVASERFLFDPGVWSLFVLALLMAGLLRLTVFGRHCYAIGSNETTARLCGLAVERTKVGVYLLSGLLTGWAGILVFAQGSGGDPTSSVGLELDVIAAVVIGGASRRSGRHRRHTARRANSRHPRKRRESVRRGRGSEIHLDRGHRHREHGPEPLATKAGRVNRKAREKPR